MILVVVNGGGSGDGFQGMLVGFQVVAAVVFFFFFLVFYYGFDFGMDGYLVLIVVV